MALQLWQIYAMFLSLWAVNEEVARGLAVGTESVYKHFWSEFSETALNFLKVVEEEVFLQEQADAKAAEKSDGNLPEKKERETNLRLQLGPRTETALLELRRWFAEKRRVEIIVQDPATKIKKEQKVTVNYLAIYKRLPLLLPMYDGGPDINYCSEEMPEFMAFFIDIQLAVTFKEIKKLLQP
jgi:hypothetical protein